MFIGEGVAIDGHSLFLLEHIGWAKGGVGERRTDRRAHVGTGAKGTLLMGDNGVCTTPALMAHKICQRKTRTRTRQRPNSLMISL